LADFPWLWRCRNIIYANFRRNETLPVARESRRVRARRRPTRGPTRRGEGVIEAGFADDAPGLGAIIASIEETGRTK